MILIDALPTDLHDLYDRVLVKQPDDDHFCITCKSMDLHQLRKRFQTAALYRRIPIRTSIQPSGLMIWIRADLANTT
jgi:hypothetical protein